MTKNIIEIVCAVSYILVASSFVGFTRASHRKDEARENFWYLIMGSSLSVFVVSWVVLFFV